MIQSFFWGGMPCAFLVLRKCVMSCNVSDLEIGPELSEFPEGIGYVVYIFFLDIGMKIGLL